MLRIDAPDFDLHACLESGQTFAWHLLPDRSWQGWIGDTPCHLRQEGRTLHAEGPVNETQLRDYFHLDERWNGLLAGLPAEDTAVQQARHDCRGLRLIRDPWWPCTANFICSSLKQIPQIRKIHWQLRKAFGPPGPTWPHCAFPTPAQIAAAPESLLRAAGLGYRARHLHRAAHMICAGDFDFDTLDALSTSEAAEALTRLPGVGDKVAHCILLYAGARYDAFPLDVWMIRLLRQHYTRPGRRLRHPRDLHRFGERHLGPLRGLAQLFLFHQGRKVAGKAGTAPSPDTAPPD